MAKMQSFIKYGAVIFGIHFIIHDVPMFLIFWSFKDTIYKAIGIQ